MLLILGKNMVQITIKTLMGLNSKEEIAGSGYVCKMPVYKICHRLPYLAHICGM